MIKLTKKEEGKIEGLIKDLLRKHPIEKEGEHYCLAFHINSIVNYMIAFSEAEFISKIKWKGRKDEQEKGSNK